MKKAHLFTSVLILFMSMGSGAEALVLCAPKSGQGTLRVREMCKKNETQLDPAALGLQSTQCPPDSVEVGSVCVDKYEASVWQTTDAMLINKIKKGQISSASELTGLATQHGISSADYEPGCPRNGNSCMDFYAVSLPGVPPSRVITWFQAVAACRNAGKRLLTNEEWQAAALGTPSGSPCIVSSPGGPGVTGTPGCTSNVGVFDMVGNVNELVGEWLPHPTNCPGWSAGFSTDAMCLAGASTSAGPGVMRRGGDFINSPGVFSVVPGRPDENSPYIGFRCGRAK